MTDDEILDAIDGRLAGIESQLPPRRLAGLSEVGRSAVQPRSATGFGSAAGLLAAVVLVAVAAAVALGVGSNQPHSSIPPSGALGEAIPQASTSVPPSVAPSPSVADLEVIRNETWDGDAVLIQRLKWGPCFVSSHSLRVRVDGRALDLAIDKAGVEEGFVTMNQWGKFWVGATPESAARGFGSPILVIDRRTIAWIVIDPIGYQLIETVTPKGRTAWSLGDIIRETAC